MQASIERDLVDLHNVALGIAAYETAPLQEQYAAIEMSLAACITVDDWQDCLDAFGEREVGSFIADWHDDTASNDAWGEGIAMLDIGDGTAAVAEWSSSGFWTVSFVTVDEAKAAVDEANADWAPDEDESEDVFGDEA